MSARLRRTLDRMLSRSVPGTGLVLAGCGVAAAGLQYGLAREALALLPVTVGRMPAWRGGPLDGVGVAVLAGLSIAVLGVQLVAYADPDAPARG